MEQVPSICPKQRYHCESNNSYTMTRLYQVAHFQDAKSSKARKKEWNLRNYFTFRIQTIILFVFQKNSPAKIQKMFSLSHQCFFSKNRKMQKIMKNLRMFHAKRWTLRNKFSGLSSYCNMN